jgi:8-oxo-dGTP diphosphatase
MKKIDVNLEVRAIFAPFRARKARTAEIMLLIVEDGQVLLHTKKDYPSGIWRLPTGGIHEGESQRSTLLREVREETGLKVISARQLATIRYRIKTARSNKRFVTHIWLVKANGKPSVQDRREGIVGFKKIPINGLPTTAAKLRRLESRYAGTISGFWSDWGKFRAIEHDIAYELLRRRR